MTAIFEPTQDSVKAMYRKFLNKADKERANALNTVLKACKEGNRSAERTSSTAYKMWDGMYKKYKRKLRS